MWTRYEIETRWREGKSLLAWGYAAEFSREAVARSCCDRMLNLPRKVIDFDCRIIKVVRDDDGNIISREIVKNETQLELQLARAA